ncbi:hypothetical protein SAMN06265371_103299 [Lutibacter agarilyticus]|uniref:Uncharacterized protein n=1 Tax=Lutibacter agarilyticus TaxID=1109740 RepID=A0A238WJQ8_9FLAO|nr:hypothetical protein [Lutibacter agarilyticus]SNR46802.1 hypothetical protein SAMN06265371_103299 [Lutibacter agarilyticus]
MNRASKIFEFGYLIVAVIFLVETFLNWSEKRESAYMMLLFAVLAIFMYFFRKRFRKKMENKN